MTVFIAYTLHSKHNRSFYSPHSLFLQKYPLLTTLAHFVHGVPFAYGFIPKTLPLSNENKFIALSHLVFVRHQLVYNLPLHTYITGLLKNIGGRNLFIQVCVYRRIFLRPNEANAWIIVIGNNLPDKHSKLNGSSFNGEEERTYSNSWLIPMHNINRTIGDAVR